MENVWKTVTTRWQDSANLVLGVWLILSPWLLQFAANAGALWNAVVVGVIIAVLALAALIEFREWEEWAGMVLGVWLVVSPWVLGFAATGAVVETGAVAATWNFIVVGLLTIALAAWSLWAERHRGPPAA